LAAVVVSVCILRVSLPSSGRAWTNCWRRPWTRRREGQIQALICSVPGVKGCHALRTRRIGAATAVEAHVLVPRELSIVEAHDVATRAERALEGSLRGQLFVNLHVEPLPEPGHPHREGALSWEGEEEEGRGGP
jgi:divalent metal cation (Fe/Co/Zn/Cd) transporter